MKTSQIEISSQPIGEGHPAYLIAEVAQAHDGSLGMAHAYVDAAADAGVDAVKFQTHIASAESTRDESFRVPLGEQDETRFDYWRRMEFTSEQWAGLAKHARERGITFLSSAFSIEAVALLERIDVPAWKVSSGEIGSNELLDAMSATKKPILLSTGMNSYDEIGAAVERCRTGGSGIALLQCTSRYPTGLEDVGLNVINELSTRFQCPAGLSDHSGSLWPSIAAMTLGAAIVEVHIVLDKRSFGPDVASSLTVEEITTLVSARDAISIMHRNPVDKDSMAVTLEPMKNLFSKSLATITDLPAGTILDPSLLTTKKPGTGIPPSEIQRLTGQKLRRAVTSDRLLRLEDLDE